MPVFAHGVLMIVPCPDADPVPPPMAMRGQHHHHGPKALHQSCPYAAAAGLGGLPAELGLLAVAVLAGLALLLGRPYCFFERQRAHDRPPLRGPPIPA
jgi:hypothetical protein